MDAKRTRSAMSDRGIEAGYSAFTRGSKTGATGLEPATPGVTGRFGRTDDWRRCTRNRSIHVAFRVLAEPIPHG
jgi:hypothetical protein